MCLQTFARVFWIGFERSEEEETVKFEALTFWSRKMKDCEFSVTTIHSVNERLSRDEVDDTNG